MLEDKREVKIGLRGTITDQICASFYHFTSSEQQNPHFGQTGKQHICLSHDLTTYLEFIIHDRRRRHQKVNNTGHDEAAVYGNLPPQQQIVQCQRRLAAVCL